MKESSKYSLLGFDETKINDKELKNAKALNSFKIDIWHSRIYLNSGQYGNISNSQ
ncbi:hypothetical protein ACP8HZ_07545 [Francisella noatunensis]